MTLDIKREEAIAELLIDIRSIVASHKAASICSYPATGLDSFLAIDGHPLEPVLPVPSPNETEPELKRVDLPDPPAINDNNHSDHQRLAEIETEVGKCRSCALSKNRVRAVAGKNGGKSIRLFIVGHWLQVSDEAGFQTVFGLEEDRMLTRMLSAIHLSVEDVFISNVIKCGIKVGIQPQAGHVEACASYLQRQISAASPDCICTMGMVAARAMLPHSQPLSKIRGRFYPYKTANGTEIPLIPTYHPGFLLQNPEMKNATWQDLQLLQKRLR